MFQYLFRILSQLIETGALETTKLKMNVITRQAVVMIDNDALRVVELPGQVSWSSGDGEPVLTVYSSKKHQITKPLVGLSYY